MIPMPGKKRRVRPVKLTHGRNCETAAIDHRANAIRIVSLPANENFKVVSKSDQAAVKHPMDSARERNAVRYDVRTATINRPNVGSFDLCPTASVNQF